MFGYVYRTLNKRTGRVYVGQKTSDKFEKDIKKTCPELSDEEVDKLVAIQLKRELSSGVQTIQYQINTLMTTNG